MVFFKSKPKQKIAVMNLNSTADQCYFLRNYVMQLDSLIRQNRISQEQYNEEMRHVDEQLTQLEIKEGITNEDNDDI